MKKNEILKSIKSAIVIALFVLGVNFVSADVWSAPAETAPGLNTAETIKTDKEAQTKEGDLYFGDLLTVDRLHSLSSATFFDKVNIGKSGQAGNPELFVLGDVTLNDLSSNNIDNEGVVYPEGVCLKSDGELKLCDPVVTPVPDGPFTFSGEFRVRRVTGSGSGTVASCFEDYPYVVGGGGYCINASGLTDPTVRKSVPIKDGESFYNAWRVECTLGGADVSAVSYVHCSK